MTITPKGKPLSAAERKANERARKRAIGLVSVQIWVHESRKKEALELGEKLREAKQN